MVYSLDLNMTPGGVSQIVKLSQYDKTIPQIEAVLWDKTQGYEIPTDAVVYVVGTKPDKTGFEYSCSFTGSTVTINVTEQMTAVAGRVKCEVVIMKDGRKGSANFFLDVEPCALDEDVTPSETDIPIIEQLPEILAEVEAAKALAESWAKGTRSGVPVTSGDPTYNNSAKYWAEKSEEYAQGALHWKGSVAFASIPTSGLTIGDYYNITDDFTTDSRFEDGSGIECAAGTNIVWNGSKWDLPTPTSYASQIKYDNTASEMAATKVQGAIDELASEKADKTALTNEVETRAKLGGHNLLQYPFVNPYIYSAGITWTDKGDGTITANGTVDSNSESHYVPYSRYGIENREYFYLPNGNYILNNQGFSDGSNNSHYIALYVTKNGSAQELARYTTQEVSFTVNGDDGHTDGAFIQVQFIIYRGSTVSNLNFSPMIRLATDSNTTFTPYAKSNLELTEDVKSIPAFLDGGAENLIPMTLDGIKSLNSGMSWSGNSATSHDVTFTVNTDSNGNVVNINVNGTADGSVVFVLANKDFGNTSLNYSTPTANGYTLSGGISASQNVRYDGITKNIDIRIQNGQSVSNNKFYPMIRDSRIKDPTFRPYAKTNLELTNDVAKINSGVGSLSLSVTFAGTDSFATIMNAIKNHADYDATKLTPFSKVVIGNFVFQINRIDQGIFTFTAGVYNSVSIFYLNFSNVSAYVAGFISGQTPTVTACTNSSASSAGVGGTTATLYY